MVLMSQLNNWAPLKLTIEMSVYRLTKVNLRCLRRDKADETGPLLS